MEVQHRLLPANGVYLGVIKRAKTGAIHPAVCNVGVAPTFEGQHRRQLEAHLLNFDDDLYGEVLQFDFYEHLRSEIKFPTVAALVAQIQSDCEQAALTYRQKYSKSL